MHTLEYSITEANKPTNAGVSVEYCELGQPMNSPEEKGFDLLKHSLPVSQKDNVKQVPGIYDFTMERDATKDARGKKQITLKPVAMAFVAPVSLQPLPVSGAPAGTASGAGGSR